MRIIRGLITMVVEWETCPVCDGMGVIFDGTKDVTCPGCQGNCEVVKR